MKVQLGIIRTMPILYDKEKCHRCKRDSKRAEKAIEHTKT